MIDIQHHNTDASEEQLHYDSLDSELKASSFDGSAAQAHGIACGLVCRDVQTNDIRQKTAHLSFSDDVAHSALENLMLTSLLDLNQAEFKFDLLLPDTEDLKIQIDAVSDWSQGYILGLMYDGEAFLAQLNAELQESVQDIVTISGLESALTQDSEDESAFVEIREYLRMAVQLIFEEMNPDRPLEPADE